MIQLTRRGDYAVRGMVFLASRPVEQVSLLNDIAAGVDVPHTLLAKIFQDLGRAGLVNSWRGAGGGFKLGRPAGEISLLDVVEAVEGPITLNRCLARQGACDRDDFCTVHPVWHNIQEKVRRMLGEVSLQQLAKQ